MQVFRTVSHGPFPLAQTESSEVAASLPTADWIAIESEHFRFLSALDGRKIEREERKEIEAWLDELRPSLPGLPRKVKKLDRWLRLHRIAYRVEAFYARFQKLLDVQDEDFDPERNAAGPFMGAGLYLGEKGKFEVIFHAQRATHQAFTADSMGVRVTDSVRWHFSPEHKMLASIPAEDADLRNDRWLLPHTIHNLSHLLLCAYRHFSYDPPVWLDEGLAHFLEREIDPLSTTLDSDEGATRHRGDRKDWAELDRKLVSRGKEKRLAEMMALQTFGQLDDDHHKTAYSMVRFLAEEHPEGFSRLLAGVKGQLDDRGYPSGKDLPGLQRRLLRSIWDWSPADFDQAWRTWVLERP